MKTLPRQFDLFSEKGTLDHVEVKPISITDSKEKKNSSVTKTYTREEKKAMAKEFSKEVAQFKPASTMRAILTLPSGDGNFSCALSRATKKELQTAITLFEQYPANNASRMKACQRQLKAIS